MTSIIKVDNLQNQCGANIISESANVITIGASGDTVTLAAGASQSGFGRSGSVNWDTTAKTTTVTAVSGNGYFINTTSGGVTVNLPAGVAGAIVALADYAATWNTNNVTVNANGTEKIGGVASAPATLNTQGQAVTLVYVDSTEGWINVGDATAVAGNAFVTATGGTITTCGDYKIHTFTGPGTFTVTNVGTPAGSTTVDYLVVAGGGGGNRNVGGGGGAGGFRQNFPSPTTAGLPVSVTSYPITVGGGGIGGVQPATCSTSGSNSVFSTITSAGGGFARGDGTSGSGGSGGGATYNQPSPVSIGGTGNTPPTSPPQGNNGGGGFNGPNGSAGGGGGASAAGSNGPNCTNSGPGGAGTATSISGSSVTYAGGGGGGVYLASAGSAGNGGIGGGGGGSSPPIGTNGTGGSPGGQTGTAPIGGAGGTNTGGGGGGGAGNPSSNGGAGGSGIVVIRYKFQ
jgi:hypothetical protein